MKDCTFCKIVSGDIPADIIYENDNFFSIPDINQQIEGHSLVVSKKHFNTFLDLPSSIGMELVDCIKQTTLRLIEKYGSDGFNIVQNNFKSAGQVVGHVHFHILPRKTGGKVPRVY